HRELGCRSLLRRVVGMVREHSSVFADHACDQTTRTFIEHHTAEARTVVDDGHPHVLAVVCRQPSQQALRSERQFGLVDSWLGEPKLVNTTEVPCRNECGSHLPWHVRTQRFTADPGRFLPLTL